MTGQDSVFNPGIKLRSRQSSPQDRPFAAYLKDSPRWEDKRGWFPGMGTKPKPPRNTNHDGYLAKRRDRS